MPAEADQMRRARKEFADAMALGISIPELRRRREADRRFLRTRARDEVSDHTEALLSGPSDASQRAFETFDAPWMMRD